MNALHDSTSAEIVGQLLDIISVDFKAAMELFVARLFGSDMHGEGLMIFRQYFDANWRSLPIEILAEYATIFAHEDHYERDYAKVCARIRNLIRLSQGSGVG